MGDEKRVTRSPLTERVTVTTADPEAKTARETAHPETTSPAERGRLTPKEEQIIRMRYGISAGPDHRLEFRGQEHDETRVKLAMIEQLAIQAMRARRGPSKKEKIIDKLTRI